jgi:hypothetical protein
LLSKAKIFIDVIWGVFEEAPTLYSRNIPTFTASVEAISLITLSLRKGAEAYDVRTCAMKRYGVALKHINQALYHPEHSLTDDTLLAIFLTSIFEVNVDHISL